MNDFNFSLGAKFFSSTDKDFKVGDRVKIITNKFDWLNLQPDYEIIGINIVDEDEVEMALKGFPFLVWKEEIEKV